MSATLRMLAGVGASQPKYLMDPKSARVNPMSYILAMAYALLDHGTPAAVRAAARRNVDGVFRPHQPGVKRVIRELTDDEVMTYARATVDGACDVLGFEPGKPFPVKKPLADVVELVQPPRCHMKPMRLAGYHAHRHWKCQHCSHTKPLDWDKPEAAAC
ncbi:MAG TPA: hypothetical protein VIZ86_16465 [Pseudomonas sp.]